MPNAAPPPRAASARRTAPIGMPAGWVGAAERLAAAQHRSAADALSLHATDASPAATQGPADLGVIWSAAADSTPARSGLSIRRIDSKGRLPLPLAPRELLEVQARRDGCVLTVYLPGSTEEPGRDAIRPLPLDRSGRLTLTKAVRHQLGVDDGADVAFTIDTDRRVLTATAASRLDNAVAAVFAVLRSTSLSPNDAALIASSGRRLRLATTDTLPSRSA